MNNEITENPIILTSDQEKALNILNSGCNCLITGDAGTGKSFVLNAYLRDMKKLKKNIVVTAPTGTAAINVGGVTFHRAFGYMPKPMVPTREFAFTANNTMKMADIIVIDEISMLRVDLMDVFLTQLDNVMKSFEKNIQVILVGDFNQLPPVITERDKPILVNNIWNLGKGYAFQSQFWNRLNLKTIILKEVVRQKDADFVNNLELIKNGDYRGILWFNKLPRVAIDEESITLCCKNDTANRINSNKLNEINNKEFIFTSKLDILDRNYKIYDSDKMNNDEVVLKVGARVMCLVNDSYGRFQNGSLGFITKINGTGRSTVVSVVFDNNKEREIDFNYFTWKIQDYNTKKGSVEEVTIATFEQIPLKLAWAITIHKSQGQTYDKCMVLAEYIFVEGLLYTALSRVKSVNGLSIPLEIPLNCKLADATVVNFYNSLRGEYYE